jgi:hypothetical protein
MEAAVLWCVMEHDEHGQERGVGGTKYRERVEDLAVEWRRESPNKDAAANAGAVWRSMRFGPHISGLVKGEMDVGNRLTY